jgi:hypothetical protein
MAIARDAASQGNVALSSTSLTWSHTISGSNRGLFVGAKVYVANDVSATYNGVSMGAQVASVLMSEAGGNYGVVWYLSNPDLGTHDIVISRSGGANHLSGAAVSFTGVKQTGQPANSATNTNSSNLSVTVAEDQSWLALFISMQFPGYAQSDLGTSRAVISGPPDFQYLHGMMERGPVGTGSQTIQTDYTANSNGNLVIVLEPAGGDAPRFILGTH